MLLPFFWMITTSFKEEIDIFSGALEGLAYLEIEFPDIESAALYPTPVWAVADVTQDLRFKNSSLAQHGLPETSFL